MAGDIPSPIRALDDLPVVAPLVLILTVVLSFFAALGAGSLAFTHVFDFPALDYQVPRLAFLFLVALGVEPE